MEITREDFQEFKDEMRSFKDEVHSGFASMIQLQAETNAKIDGIGKFLIASERDRL
jgi:hypothetical protein